MLEVVDVHLLTTFPDHSSQLVPGFVLSPPRASLLASCSLEHTAPFPPERMPRLQPASWKLFEKLLLHVGCVLKRQESSHRVYWKEGLKRPIILQAKGSVPVFIILNNLRTPGIDREEYLKTLDSL